MFGPSRTAVMPSRTADSCRAGRGGVCGGGVRARPGRGGVGGGTWRAAAGPGGECLPVSGLVAFGEPDAPFFFGREAATAEVLDRMARLLAGAGLLVVSGVSGCGEVVVAAG